METPWRSANRTAVIDELRLAGGSVGVAASLQKLTDVTVMNRPPPTPTYDSSFFKLLQHALIAVVAGSVAVVVCYYWIDRPVAFFVHRHHLSEYRVCHWLTYPPPMVQTWSPLVLAVLVVRRAWGPFAPWQKTLLVACLSLIVADQFRTSLGDFCGRYWPETWFDHNPSLIGNGAYGFHPFEHGDDVGSFPSGHAARILGFAGVWWLAIPRSRLLCLIASPPMLVSLVAMNYHFVGDVIAGGILGGIIAGFAVQFANLQWRARSNQAAVGFESEGDLS